MHFLFKEEPTNYSFDAFAKDGKATWTGVKNPVAQRNLRSVRKGDLVFYYHTGDEKQIVGIAKAAGDAYPERPNSVARVSDGQFHTLTTTEFSDQQVAALGGQVRNVHRMNLEEIFVASVMHHREARGQ